MGVQTRGVGLANRIRERIEELSGVPVKSGILDITFHRDDLATRGVLPAIKETKIEFDITNMVILLVDDVIFTGRTTKAALETLTTFGRPKAISFLYWWTGATGRCYSARFLRAQAPDNGEGQGKGQAQGDRRGSDSVMLETAGE